MGRPSKKEERTEEILNAFYRCVARFGLRAARWSVLLKNQD